jgi:glycosyltransferase involved in cell wall biosynthesis
MPTKTVRPRICIVCTTPLAIHFFLQPHIRALAESCEITVLTNIAGDDQSPPLDLPIRILPIAIQRRISPLSDLIALTQTIAIIAKGNYDLVWGVGPKGGLLGMMAATLCRVRRRLFIFQGEVWASKHGFSRWLIKSMDRLTARCATHLLAVSHSEKDFLISERVTRPNAIGVLAGGSIGGVDTGHYTPCPERRQAMRTTLGIPQTAKVALFLGRINPDKGIIDLLHAFVKARQSGSDLWLVIVGPDEGNIVAQVPLVLGVEMAYCRIEGFTTNSADYFIAADFLCLPSYREGFPVSILEAAACGIPTVGTNIYGITDAILDNETGLLFPPHDSSALARLMSLLSDDPAILHRLGNAARHRVLKEFEQRTVVSRYVDFIRNCL